MEYEDVIRAECSYVDQSDMREDLRQPHRVKCDLGGEDFNETVFADEWSFHDTDMMLSQVPNLGYDYDFVVTDVGDCEKNLLPGGSRLTCGQ